MKLATFSTPSEPRLRLGCIADGFMIDVGAAGGPATMSEFLSAGDVDRAGMERALASAPQRVPTEDATLHAPVPNPGKVLAIGLNYADHIEESGMPRPKTQVWFNKQHNCINGPYDPINLPVVSDALDYEAELCVVIGRRAKHVPRGRAHEVIAGYCCGNDVSVRDWQMRAQTMQIGKSFDTHGPIGPYLVTPDEVPDPHALEIRCWVNGELRQSSNTRHLIFDCFDAVEHLTKAFTLDPGDVLFMGTPAGVGAAMDPRRFLTVGDVVRVEIESLGHIENRVVAEQAETIID